MNILVTGATGFTGGALAQKLIELGNVVRVIVRKKYNLKLHDTGKLEIVEGSIVEKDIVDEALKDIDKVFHIAAVFREGGLKDQDYWDVHVKATENLLNSSLKHNIKRFIHCSTMGVHGHIKMPPANEDSPYSPGDIYQITKLEGEKTALNFYKKTKLPVAVVRPCAIYGPGDMRLLKLFRMAKRKPIILLGDGEIYYHLVYIDDLVNGFILASEKDEAVGESFLIGGEKAYKLNEIMDKISKILGTSNKKIHLPVAPFQIAGSVCEKICIPLGIKPPIYRRRVDFFTKSRSFDISKAKNILGYQPKFSIGEGLEKTAQWYKEKRFLD